MAGLSNFPEGLDDFVDPVGDKVLGDPTQQHSVLHSQAADALAAIEAKVGEDGSVDTTSLDYKARLGVALTFAFGG